ncbi:MAG: cache domain-containing protein, partial [Gammaproteobacteria bacterium]|nr:cache domain-containing protein [Gammaproteobacteria bacterium]
MINAKLLIRSCAVLSVIGFLLAVVMLLQYRADNRTLLDDALASARQASERARDHIGGTLVLIARTVDETAGNILRDGTPSEANILATTRDLIYSDAGFQEAGVAFAPFAYHPRIRLYGLAHVIENNGVRFKDLDAHQDYTKPSADWYHRPMEGSAVWLAPRFDKRHGQARVTYGAPLREPGGSSEPVGIMFATYALNVFQRVLDALDLGQNGYSFVLSSERRFILHPNRDFGEQQMSFDSFLERVASSREASSIETAFRDPTSTAAFVDPDTGLSSRLFFRGIPATNWVLGVVLADRDVLMPARFAHRKLINIVLVLAIATVLLAIALARIDRDPTRGLWIVSSVLAGSCVLVGVFVIALAMRQQLPEGDNITRITNWNTLNRFTSEQRRRTLIQREEVPLFIPTG